MVAALSLSWEFGFFAPLAQRCKGNFGPALLGVQMAGTGTVISFEERTRDSIQRLCETGMVRARDLLQGGAEHKPTTGA